MKSSFTRQLWLLGRRSIVGTFRDPGNLGPAVAVPLVLYAIIAGGLGDVTKIKGFPTSSIVTFALTIPFAQGAMMTIANTGQSIALDIEHGFISRLVLTPLRRVALVAAQLLGALALGAIQAGIFFGVGFASGAHIKAGVSGALVILGLFLCSVIGFGAIGLFVGLWTASPAAVAGIAPLSAVFLFLSSMAMPRNLIETDWFEKVATFNPLSYLVEGFRSPMLESRLNAQAIGLGFAVAGGLVLLGIFASTRMLSRRLAER
jgi:ABC-2 type transport system permease protein